MKKLFLIRHAKSSWEDFNLDDFDRPLNNRGEKDAPFMGKLLKKKKPKPDLIISSPALRTKLTAQIMAKEIGYDDKIVFDKTIYEAPLSNLKRAINNIDNSFNSIVFVYSFIDSYKSLFHISHFTFHISHFIYFSYIHNIFTPCPRQLVLI